ncbi:DUF5666 domain-containing protein [Ahniella affigens]|nr:DUF5666 domain-containing protein [Ahniella affigens]
MKHYFSAGLMCLSFGGSAQSLDLVISGEPVTLPLDTPIILDDQPATLNDLRYHRDGLHARWHANAAMEGLATPIFSYTLIGLVTQSSPLAVLGQPLTITADTNLLGVGPSLTLPLGTPVVVSGLVDANGSVLASLVERRGALPPRFLLTGPVTAIGAPASLVQVGAQWVDLAGLAVADCVAAAPQVGEFLEIRATGTASLPPGATLGGVTDARCVDLVPVGTPAATGFLEGLVTEVTSATQFLMGDLTINILPETTFALGSIEDLDPGVGVILHGSYVDATHFDAADIEFVYQVVRFEGPVAPAAVLPGTQITVLGIPVRWSAQVRDRDDILAQGLTQSRQVQVRGYVDRQNRAFATLVRDRGNPDASDVAVRGPVQAITPPRVTIQGLQVDTTGATFADEFGAPLTAEQFFAGVQVGQMVDASAAVYNAAQQSLLAGAIVWIDAPAVRRPRATTGTAPADITAGTARQYAFIEPMYANDFE